MTDSDEAFRKVIAESGNAFHCAAATAFRNAGWSVLLSPYYADNATDKAREIDLLCERIWEFPSNYNQPTRVLRMQLLVECKYIKQDTSTVIWFDGRNEIAVDNLITNTMRFFERNSYVNQHHYKSAPLNTVAKLFESHPKKSEDREPLYVGLNQCWAH